MGGDKEAIIVRGVNNFYNNDVRGYGKLIFSCDLKAEAGTFINAGSSGSSFWETTVEFEDSSINVKSINYDFLNARVTCNGTTQINGYKNIGGFLVLNDQSRIDNAGAIYNNKLTINSAEVSLHINDDILLRITGSEQSKASVTAVAGSKISLAGQTYQTKDNIDDYVLAGDVAKQETPPQYQKVEGETYTQPDLSFLNELATPQTYQKKDDDKQYGEIIKQYDSLIKDSSYKGINLLREQDLTVTFNENRSAQLSVQGKDASAKALGLVTTDWETQSDIAQSLAEISGALNQIRQMSSELGNYYSIVTTRENFTQNLINVLTEGADKLTLADMNEESANMLALQIRQQLAVNSLSLASQASQSILKLF